jgi:hypothetical protein
MRGEISGGDVSRIEQEKAEKVKQKRAEDPKKRAEGSEVENSLREINIHFEDENEKEEHLW